MMSMYSSARSAKRSLMETAPLRQELLQIGDFLDQRMAECVRDVGIDPAPLQKTLLYQGVEIGLKRRTGNDPLQHALPERPADHGGRAKDATWSRSQTVDARAQHLVHAVGNNQRQRPPPDPHPSFLRDRPGLSQRVSELLDEERVAPALEQHRLKQRRLDVAAKT